MYRTATLLLLLLFILVIESQSLLINEHKRWKKRVTVRDEWMTVRPVRPNIVPVINRVGFLETASFHFSLSHTKLNFSLTNNKGYNTNSSSIERKYS